MSDFSMRYYLTGYTLENGGVSSPLCDASGNLKVNIAAGSSAGTEYTEAAAAAANPAGGALILVRRDTLSASEVSADGDNVAAKATSKGELRTNDADANAALGVTTGAAVVTDANGTIQQYLRGIITKMIAQLPAALAANGGLKVEGVAGGVAQPVSGTVSSNPITGQTGVAGGAGAVGATTQRVISAGLDYETVAASQTAQVLGATGATGDYLSHVVLQPTTTAAGTMTILDNATVIFTFTTGTLSDLRPITIPINATSVSGAWKITTGANETATAFGDFT